MNPIGRTAVRCMGVLGLVFCSLTGLAQDTKTITLHYYERKPFLFTNDEGVPDGLVVEASTRVFKKASIPFTWKQTPVNRIFATHKENSGADCSVGWYKNADRESFGKFTLPIYRDKPAAGLVRADSPIADGVHAKDLLARPQFRLLVKQGIAYGAYPDALIAKMAPAQVQSATGEIPTLVQMIRVARADMTFMTAEELEYMVTQSGFKMKDFKVLHFSDVPAVEMRHIFCSKQVPDETINLLNEAIKAVIHIK